MKKELVILSLIFISLIGMVSALEINIKENYQPAETLFISLSGNFIDNIEFHDIEFRSGRTAIPIIYDTVKIQNKFYIYALLPNKQRNYTLLIKDAHYFEVGQEKTEDLSYNFSVSGEPVLFSIIPGFIITDKDFYVKVRSNIQGFNLQSEFLDTTIQTEIKPGQTKQIDFSIGDITNFTVTTIKFSAEDYTYEMPIEILPPEDLTDEQTTSHIIFSKESMNIILEEDTEYNFAARLLNLGQEKIKNINIVASKKFSGLLTIQPEMIDLEPESSKEINFTIQAGSEEFLEGIIEAYSENQSTSFSLSINITAGEVDTIPITTEKTCSELGGLICGEEESCKGSIEYTDQGKCCLGNCKKKSSSRMIWIIIILALLAGIAFYVYKKLKKPTKKEDILKEKQKKYEERIRPKPTQEVRGNLER